MAYDLRARKVRKDYLPLVWYLLPRDCLLIVAGQLHGAPRVCRAASSSQRAR